MRVVIIHYRDYLLAITVQGFLSLVGVSFWCGIFNFMQEIGIYLLQVFEAYGWY